MIVMLKDESIWKTVVITDIWENKNIPLMK